MGAGGGMPLKLMLGRVLAVEEVPLKCTDFPSYQWQDRMDMPIDWPWRDANHS